MAAASATHDENQRRGWWVMPELTVTAVRPPGMKRAVTSSMPPRLRMCLAAVSSRLAPLGPRNSVRVSTPDADEPN